MFLLCIRLFLTITLLKVQSLPIDTFGPTVELFNTTFSPIKQGSIIFELFNFTADAVIWVKQVDQPEAYGVVKLNEKNEIIELVEKPKDFVSDLAVIGIYILPNP